MELRRSKKRDPYDIWTSEESSIGSKKLHPSTKRNKKTPLPHPGQSYNPHPEDHRDLLQKIAKKELEVIKKNKTVNDAMRVKVTRSELIQSEKKELESGIEHLLQKDASKKTDKSHASDSSDTEEAFSDYDERDFQAIMKDKKVVEKRKSKQQRLRQLRDRLERKAAKLRKLKNIRMSKFNQIKKMIKELNQKEKEDAMKPKKRKKVNSERLGQKLDKSDPIYCLSDQLPEKLRKVSCRMDAIVREQLENFQARLLVEPSSVQTKKRKYAKRKFARDSS